MPSEKPPVILVDGSSYLFRAFFAMPHLSNGNNEPTGAILGVINMLKKLRETYQPEFMGVVFDAKGKTFRHDMFKDYKATRPPMPDELRQQIEPLHNLIRAMGYKLILVPGVEADDVIGTLSRLATGHKLQTIISTGDKDMAQLVDDHVSIVDTMKDELYDADGVLNKYGVKPDQIIDYLALMGDKSDNIPGVPGVGAVKAAKLLADYGNIDNIISSKDDISGKLGENVRNNIEQLKLSRELTTIKCDLELELGTEDLEIAEADNESLRKLFTHMEFRTWLDELAGGAEQKQQASKQTEYETVLDSESFERWIKRLEAADQFAFDTETTSLDYMAARVVGVSFAVEQGKAAYVPFGHDYIDAPDQLTEEQVLGALKPLLEDESKAKLGQNLKYDAHVLMNHGIEMRGIANDTMLMSFVLDSTQRHDMDNMALRLLGHNTIHFEEIAGKGAKQLTFNQVDLEQAGPYAAEDADITLQLFERLSGELDKQASLQPVYDEIELPLLPVIQRIERNGVKVDVDMLQQQSRDLAERMQQVQEEAFSEAGEEFNLASPKQLGSILFEKLELPVIRKTPKGQPSTAEDVLQELADEYSLPQLILEHRSLSKLKSTYTDKLPEQVCERTGRVHTSYNQTGAATGRLSSTDPNLQNIPIRSEEGRKIRQAFIAESGNVLIAADYSQIELRIMAHLSEDESLLKAFADGVDVHRATAAEVVGGALEDVETEQRRAAKAINFGLIYGMSAFGLAKQLGIGRFEAQDYVDLYFERYPGVKAYMDTTRARAHDDGYVETVFGRRLYLPEINARNKQRQQYAERTAINAPMQGTAADIIKRAMIRVDRVLADSDLDAMVVMQVHDELVIEVPEAQREATSMLLVEHMQSAAELRVPLVVDVGTGTNWDQAH